MGILSNIPGREVMAWFETNFLPCPKFDEDIPIVTTGRSLGAGATIEGTPITETPVADPANLIDHKGEAQYVGIHGLDRYCIYPVRTNSDRASTTLAHATAYGTRTQMQWRPRSSVPIGVLIDTQGVSFAPAANGHDWYLVGGEEATRHHLAAVRETAAYVYWYEHAPLRSSRSRRISARRADTPKGPTAIEAQATLETLWHWSNAAPEGDSTLADLVRGRVDYSTAAPYIEGVPLEYHAMPDRFMVYPELIERIDAAFFPAAASAFRHELAHQASHDRATVRPFREIVWGGITVYGQTIACRYLNTCGGNPDLPLLKKGRLQKELAGYDPLEEAIAFTAEAVAVERWSPAIRVPIQEAADRRRRGMLTNIARRELPIAIQRLGRGYYVEGLQAVLDPVVDAEAIAQYVAEYDTYLACAEGRFDQCPAPYRIPGDQSDD